MKLIFLPKTITVIGWIITGISWGIVLVTMPFSLCVCFKVSQSPNIKFSQRWFILSNIWQQLGPEYFLSFPQKTSQQRKLRQTKCLLFNFWMIKLTKTPILPNCAKCQMAFCWYNCKVIIQKWKSKHLVCLSFLCWQVFLREWENTYSGLES